MRPNWAEISLSALAENYRTIHRHINSHPHIDGETREVLAVVKCDGYGHGGEDCALALEQLGAKWFGVTSTDEALCLRDAGVKANILLMTGFWRGEAETVLEQNLTPAVATIEHIEELEAAATKLNRAERSVPVHLKVDTGMSRFGIAMSDLADFAEAVQRCTHIELDGIFSHLASSEVLDSDDAKAQISAFADVLRTIEQQGLTPRYKHLANTGAITARPVTWHNLVRAGLSIFGYESLIESNGTPVPPLGVRPVLSWKSRIIAVRDVPTGTRIGYGGTYVTTRPTRLGLLAVGYGDGYTRSLSNKGRVIVRDQYSPILGKVSMDLTIIDITDIAGSEIGDEVILIGGTEHCWVGADEHAEFAGTIVYEILCNINKRVPRIFYE